MTYSIISAVKERDYDSNYGPMTSYVLILKDESGTDVTAKVNQKKETPPPSGTLSGHIEATDYGPKFIKDKPAFSGGGAQTASSGRNPDERASIERQVSLKCAVEFAGYVIPTMTKSKTMTSTDILLVAEAFDAFLKGEKAHLKPKVIADVQTHPEDEPQSYPDEEA